MRHNEFGQPIGDPVEAWTARPRPPRTPMEGPLLPRRAAGPGPARRGIARRQHRAADDRRWTYLSADGFADVDAYRHWLGQMSAGDDVLFHAIVDGASNQAVGVAAYLRIDPANGAIEVGHINYSSRLQQTRAATEAMFLMMRRAFDELGYRRYEWKCDSLNEPSRRAAARLGFQLRGDLPPGGRLQGPQQRHRVVLDSRQRVAGLARRLRALARAGQLRRCGASAAESDGARRGRRDVGDRWKSTSSTAPTSCSATTTRCRRHATPTGQEVAAVRGVVASLLGMINAGATHVAVATDHVIESFRNRLWRGYKTSAGIEPALLSQFRLLEEARRRAGHRRLADGGVRGRRRAGGGRRGGERETRGWSASSSARRTRIWLSRCAARASCS